MAELIKENPTRGLYQIKTDEYGVVGFKFGMNTWKMFTDETGTPLTELHTKLEKIDLSTIIDLMYTANVSYSIKKKKESKLTKYDIGDIIDEVGFDVVMELIGEGIKTFTGDDVKDSDEPKKKGHK